MPNAIGSLDKADTLTVFLDVRLPGIADIV